MKSLSEEKFIKFHTFLGLQEDAIRWGGVDIITLPEYPKCCTNRGRWNLSLCQFITSLDLLQTIIWLFDWKRSWLYHRLSGRRVCLTTWSNLCRSTGQRSKRINNLRTNESVIDRFGTDRSWVDDNREVSGLVEMVEPLTVVCGPYLPKFIEDG